MNIKVIKVDSENESTRDVARPCTEDEMGNGENKKMGWRSETDFSVGN